MSQRKDAKITTKGKRASVRIPNASTLGGAKRVASPGDFIVFRIPDDPHGERYARVIGRVDAAGWDGGDKTPIKGHIACVMLSCGLASAHEMWVEPEWVTECHSAGPQHVRFFTAFFTADPSDLLRMSEYGSLAAHDWSTCALPEKCAECERTIHPSNRSGINSDHADTCSLHPNNVQPEQGA